MSALIVLVNRDPRALRLLEGQLSECGYLIAVVTTFAEARSLLESATPDLLIADVRLETHNGLHLAIWSRVRMPDVPVIVTHAVPDPVAEAEAVQHGAAFVSAPQDNPLFLSEVHAAIARRQKMQRPIRRWLRRPAPTTLEAMIEETSAQVMDVCYGGMRLMFNGTRELPETFDVSVPEAGMTLRANRVWTSQPAAQTFQCGAEVTGASAEHWRRFVDALGGRWRNLPRK